MVARHVPGSKVNVQVLRKGELKTFVVTLDALDDEDKRAAGTNEPAADDRSLGAELSDAPDGGGAVVRRVRPNSKAEGALRPGDVIVEVGQTRVKNAAEAAESIKRAREKGPVLLRVEREGKGRYVAIDPVKNP